MKKNNSKIIALLIVSVVVLISSIAYVIINNKNTDKTLLMKSFEEISYVIENNIPNEFKKNIIYKGEINSKYFNKINFELKKKNSDFELSLNNTILSYQNKESFIFNSELKNLGFLKKKKLIKTSVIEEVNYKETYKNLKNSFLKALEKTLKPSNFKKHKENNMDKYVLNMDKNDVSNLFIELSKDEKFLITYKKLTGKSFNYLKPNKNNNFKNFKYILYTQNNMIKKIIIDNLFIIKFDKDYKIINYKNDDIYIDAKLKNNKIFENIKIKYNNMFLDIILKKFNNNEYIYDLKYKYLENTSLWTLNIKDKKIELNGTDLNFKVDIYNDKNLTLSKLETNLREATNEEIEEIIIKLLQTIIKTS